MKKVLTVSLILMLLSLFWVLPLPEKVQKTAQTQASFAPNLDPSGKFLADEIIVKYKAGVTDDLIIEDSVSSSSANLNTATSSAKTKKRLKDVLSEHQAFYIKDKDLDGAKVIKVSADKRNGLIEKLKNNPNIEYVENNFVGQALEGGGGGGGGGGGSQMPNDEVFVGGNQWNLNMINAPVGWLWNKGSSSVAIAVIDTGVDYNHHDLGLAPTGKVIKGWNYIENNGDPNDPDGHGTEVASIAAARTNNSHDIAAVNWHAKIVAYRACSNRNWCPTDAVAASINNAAGRSDVKVIHMSLGNFPDTNTLKNAVANARAAGKIVVASTVNSFNPDCFVTFPAAYEGVFAVVATGRTNEWRSGCARKTLDNGTAFNPVMFSAPGLEIVTLDRANNGHSIKFGSATSYAAPHISGMLAILAGCSTTTQAQFAMILGNDGIDSTWGWRRPNLYKALDVYCI